MSWKVHLEFEEGGSSKFWRARVEGATLYVNYGRIGSDGQTQVKALASAEVAEKELAKLEKEKRKKGYEDAGGGGGGGDDDEPDEDLDDEGDEDEDDEDEAPARKKGKAAAPAPAPAPAAAKPAAKPFSPVAMAKAAAPEHAGFELVADGRKVQVKLSLTGNKIRTVSLEEYASAAEAREAYKALKEGMVGDGGFTVIPPPGDL